MGQFKVLHEKVFPFLAMAVIVYRLFSSFAGAN